ALSPHQTCVPKRAAQRFWMANMQEPRGALLEESDDQGMDILEQARKEVKNARYTATASFLLAGAAVAVLVASMLTHPSLSDPSEVTVLDNTVYPLFPGVPKLAPGTARCITNAVVREGHDPISPKVAVIREGTKVQVAEVRGRRVRLTAPVEGWVSSMSNDGIEVIRMVHREEIKEKFKRFSNNRPMPVNQTVEEGVAQLRDQLMKLSSKRGKMLDVLTGFVKRISDKTKVHEVADAASDSATQVVDKVKQAIEQIDLDKLDPKQVAHDLLNGKVHLPGNINLDLLKPSKEQPPQPAIDVVE
ncbi:unnamed protein product, partial [Effrenium voratum]